VVPVVLAVRVAQALVTSDPMDRAAVALLAPVVQVALAPVLIVVLVPVLVRVVLVRAASRRSVALMIGAIRVPTRVREDSPTLVAIRVPMRVLTRNSIRVPLLVLSHVRLRRWRAIGAAAVVRKPRGHRRAIGVRVRATVAALRIAGVPAVRRVRLRHLAATSVRAAVTDSVLKAAVRPGAHTVTSVVVAAVAVRVMALA
jgi:hypothetical protein